MDVPLWTKSQAATMGQPDRPLARKNKKPPAVFQRDCARFLREYDGLGFPRLPGPLYCLPLPLIDAIRSNTELFAGEEFRWEKRLSAWCQRQQIAGFLDNHPISLGPLDLSDILQRNAHRQKHRRYNRLPSSAKGTYQAPDDFVNSPEMLVRQRRRAYAGWLVTNPQYRRELKELNAKAQRVKVPPENLQAIDWANLAQGACSPQGSFRNAYVQFCQRWCLAGLLSWDIPLPQGPIFSDAGGVPHAMGKMGTSVFLPMTLKCPAKFLSPETLEEHRKAATRAAYSTGAGWEHIRDWVENDGMIGTRQINYGDLFIIWFYWTVLQGRYADFYGITMRLCESFGSFLEGPGPIKPRRVQWGIVIPYPGAVKVRQLLGICRRRLGNLASL